MRVSGLSLSAARVFIVTALVGCACSDPEPSGTPTTDLGDTDVSPTEDATGDVDGADTSDGGDATAAGDDSTDDTVEIPDDGNADGTDDIIDVVDIGDDTPGADTTDVPDAAVGCPCVLPAGITDCSWCELEAVVCSSDDDCVAEATKLAKAQTLPPYSHPFTNDTIANFPDCYRSTCVAGTCEPLTRFPDCCTDATPDQCPGASDCLQATCAAQEITEQTPITGLEGANRRYCLYNYNASCCGGSPNTVVLGEDGDSGFPAGWTQTQVVANAFTKWWAIPAANNDAHCRGGGCLFLGFATGDLSLGGSLCHTFFAPVNNGDLDPNTCTKSPGVTTGETVTTTLTSDSIALTETAGTKAGQPWALTFWYRMNGDPPSPGAAQEIGDTLEVWIEDSAKVSHLVFTSADSSNTTGGKHVPVSVDLTRFRGQTIRVSWRFDTHNVTDDLFEGVYLDDITIQSLCGQATCGGAGGVQCGVPETCQTVSCVESIKTTPLVDEEPIAFCLESAVPGCVPCVVDGDCQKSGTVGACKADGTCKFTAGECPPEILSESFESPTLPASWEFFNDGFCSNAWSSSTHRSTDGSRALYFGRPTEACKAGEPLCAGGNGTTCPTFECSDSGSPTYGEITTDTIPLPLKETLLSFKLFLSNEYLYTPPTCGGVNEPPCALLEDRFEVYAVEGDGTESLLWDNLGNGLAHTDCEFKPVTIDVSELAGKNVQFKFVFDSVGGQFNRFEGAYIDDLSVNPKCNITSGQTCTDKSDCIPVDSCHEVECDAGVCVQLETPDCCASDADCELDGNSCTEDKCNLITRTCTEPVLKGAPCCDGDAAYAFFDLNDGIPAEWVAETPAGVPSSVKWTWADGQGLQGTAGVWFTNPANGTYEAPGSAVGGSLTTTVLSLPAVDPIVSFDLWLDTEFRTYTAANFADYVSTSSFFYQDQLTAFVQVEGTTQWVRVWRSDDGQPLPGHTVEDGSVRWVKMAFSLAAYEGQNVRVRFVFDSANAEGNAYGGAKIDNIAVRQICPQPGLTPCLADAWCYDKNACTADSCSGECINEPIPGKAGCCFPTTKGGNDFDTGKLPLGWTVLNAANALLPEDNVRWHVSNLQGKDSAFSLRFGAANDGDYSSCECDPGGPVEACNGGCAPTQCVSASGVAAPAGTVVSAELPISQGTDYSLAFALRAELSTAEVEGFIEDFRVELVRQGPVQLETIATLVCHGADCDAYNAQGGFDPCGSGINFTYPGCPAEGAPGDYGAWRSYNFKLSQVLCSSNNPLANSLRSDIAQLGAGAPLPNGLKLRISFRTTDNADNCGQGLFVDQLSWTDQCPDPQTGTEWTGQCP